MTIVHNSYMKHFTGIIETPYRPMNLLLFDAMYNEPCSSGQHRVSILLAVSMYFLIYVS